MTKTNNSGNPPETSAEIAKERRALLKKLGRFATVTAPTVTLLLAATGKPKKALAVSAVSSRQLKDPQGPADCVALLTTLPGIGNGVAIDMIDGVGVCLAAIKALSAKVETIEAGLQAARRKKAA